MKNRSKIEFGDFQTPQRLAQQTCELLKSQGFSFSSVVEPTCGKGSFLVASETTFPNCDTFYGYEINPDYVLESRLITQKASIQQSNFFAENWQEIFQDLPEPILVVGNPPWVTNSGVGTIKGTNLPEKSNFQNRKGFDALTGKSNFDISEWMLTHLLTISSGRSAVIAMLCKTVVARKVLEQAWTSNIEIARANLYEFDSMSSFGVSVDACLMICVLQPSASSSECQVFESFNAKHPRSTFALRSDKLVANLDAHDTYGHLRGRSTIKWRSGIKHDCARVMELRPEPESGVYINGFGKRVRLESTFLYPMLKSSDLARRSKPSRFMLVPQCSIGQETDRIAYSSPLTWDYLESYADVLDSRSSTIYRNRPRFSIFGIGDYSFAPWKVAISGFYKKLDFVSFGPKDGKPVVLDDTCYFLPCESRKEADQLVQLLNTEEAKGFFSAFLFWDAKRPITAKLLSNLDLDALAVEQGSSWASWQNAWNPIPLQNRMSK